MWSATICLLLVADVRGDAIPKRQPLMRSQKETSSDHPQSDSGRHFENQTSKEMVKSSSKVEQSECGFDDWSAWSACTKSCNTGQRVRTREVIGLWSEKLNAKDFLGKDSKSLEQIFSKMKSLEKLTPKEVSHHSILEVKKIQFSQGVQAARWSGKLMVTQPGRYTFEVSPVRGRVRIGAALHADLTEKKQKFQRWLVQGSHSFLFEAIEIAASANASSSTSSSTSSNASDVSSASLLKYRGPDTEGKLIDVPSEVLRHGASGSCRSASAETQNCNEKRCSVDCAWGDWAEWSSCSCGGTRKRSRPVAVQAMHGGNSCSESTSTAPCEPSQPCDLTN